MSSRNNRTILIVEDDDAIRVEVASILLSEGYQVISKTNGQEALDFLITCPSEELPRCILLDLMMPVMTGKMLIEKIASYNDPEITKLPIIIATAKGSTNAEKSEVSDLFPRIRKPFDLDELLNVIEEHCGPV